MATEFFVVNTETPKSVFSIFIFENSITFKVFTKAEANLQCHYNVKRKPKMPESLFKIFATNSKTSHRLLTVLAFTK